MPNVVPSALIFNHLLNFLELPGECKFHFDLSFTEKLNQREVA